MNIDKQRKIGTIIFIVMLVIIVACGLADSTVQQEIRDWAKGWQDYFESYFADKIIVDKYPFLVTITPSPTPTPTLTPTPTITPTLAPTRIGSSPEEAAAIAIEVVAPELIDVLDIHWWDLSGDGETIKPMLTLWFLAKDMGPDSLWNEVHKEIQKQLQYLSQEFGQPGHSFAIVIAEEVEGDLITFYWAMCPYENYMTLDVSSQNLGCYTDKLPIVVPEENLRFMDN